jgi:hypothetical protein
MKRLLITAAALLALVAPAAHAAEPETYGFQFSPGDDNCMIKYPRADGLTVSWMLFKNNMLIAGVVKDKWDIVNAQDTGNTHKLTFDYGGGLTTTAASSGYLNAEVQGVYGIWRDEAGAGNAAEGLGALGKGQVVTVSFDGKVLGTFDMKMKGFAASMLKNCVADLNKKAN